MRERRLGNVLHHVRTLAASQQADDLSDHELLEGFATCGDEAAFGTLVKRHGPMVLGVCRRVLNHTQDAEDACQATFLVLARKAASVRKHEALGGWLYRVAGCVPFFPCGPRRQLWCEFMVGTRTCSALTAFDNSGAWNVAMLLESATFREVPGGVEGADLIEPLRA